MASPNSKVKKSPYPLFIAAWCAACLWLTAPVIHAADKIPALLGVPTILPENEQGQLNQRKQELELHYAAFKKAGDLFSAKKAKDQTDEEFNTLQVERKRVIEDRNFFNQTIGLRVRTLLSEARPVPALDDIAPALPDPPRSNLTRRRTELVATRDALHIRRTYFEEHCHIYTATEARACTAAAIQLLADTEACTAAVKSFNWDLEQSFGEERIRLEGVIRGLDQALDNDATAVKRFGFDRRAEDFEKWAGISEEAKHKVVDKLLEQIFEIGGDKMREGIFEQLSNADDKGIDQMLLKLQTLGLGAAASADALREYKGKGIKDLPWLRSLAKQLNEDLRSVIKFDENYQLGNNFEAGLETLKYFLPPGPREIVSLAEVSAWATYGAGMQVVAVVEVERLNELTDKELLALQKIHCVSERHILARYEAKVKLAALLNQNDADLVKPVTSRSCSKSQRLE